MSNNRFEVEYYDLEKQMLSRTVKPEKPKEGFEYTGLNGGFDTITSDGVAFGGSANLPGTGSRGLLFNAHSGRILSELPPDLWGIGSSFIPGTFLQPARASLKEGTRFELAPTDVVIYDWRNAKVVTVLTGHSPPQMKDDMSGASATVSGDGKTIVTLDRYGEVLVYDISDLQAK
jgi:hypothetical protein